MTRNAELAERLNEMAQMLELLEAGRFRIIAYERAAGVVRDLADDVAELARDRDRLTSIDGIGDKMADKIIAFVATGAIPEHQALRQQVPDGLLPILGLSGIGPKTVRLLWKQLGVTDTPSLERAIDDGSILALPRMGQKTVDNIRRALAFARSSSARVPLGAAVPLAESIVEALRTLPGVRRAAYAGSMRRGRETVGDIDVLVSAQDAGPVHNAFCTLPGVTEVLAKGSTRSSVRLELPHARGVSAEGGSPVIQADLRVVPDQSWGAALLYFTGSKAHNVRLRDRALAQKLTLNEYGLYPNDNEATTPQSRGVQPVASASEAEIYAALGLPELPPEIREDRGELDLRARPRLIELHDIRAELHAHTTASDGSMTIEALAHAALARGMHTIAVTDHSKSSVQAGGLDEPRLRAQREHVQRARDALGGSITILHGSEVDILTDGRLDFNDDTLAELDIVVASPHAALTQDPVTATKRLLRAIEHPAVRILGHPTARVFGKREGLSPEMADIVAAAAEHRVALEINAHWLRLDLRDTHARAAVEAGALLAINCDVHAPADFDQLRFGVATARRGWLTPDRCVNAWPADRLTAWLADRRAVAS